MINRSSFDTRHQTTIIHKILSTTLFGYSYSRNAWVCDPCKNISHIQVLVTNYSPTPPIKLKLRLLASTVGARLLIATHLEQSNYLPNQKQGAVNEYNLTVFIVLFQGSENVCIFLRVPASFQWIHWIHETHPRFFVQGHILSIGGDALYHFRLLLRLCSSRCCCWSLPRLLRPSLHAAGKMPPL